MLCGKPNLELATESIKLHPYTIQSSSVQVGHLLNSKLSVGVATLPGQAHGSPSPPTRNRVAPTNLVFFFWALVLLFTSLNLELGLRQQ
jgi:hypothetical protein